MFLDIGIKERLSKGIEHQNESQFHFPVSKVYGRIDQRSTLIVEQNIATPKISFSMIDANRSLSTFNIQHLTLI